VPPLSRSWKRFRNRWLKRRIEDKRFFFEKNKQKTFLTPVHGLWPTNAHEPD